MDLEAQSDTDFVWVVVDDASTDSTAELLSHVASASSVEVHVITNVTQLGKCASLNRAFDSVISPFYLVVDSDDRLDLTAVASVRTEVERYAPDSSIGAIFFSYMSTDGQLLGGPPDGRSVVATRAEFDARWGKYDGSVGYFRRVVCRFRYPEYSGETYCGPTVLQLTMAPTFRISFTNVAIGKAEYQPDGLTAAGRALRIDNPRGMMEYTRLQREQALTRYVAARNLVMHFAYSRFVAREYAAKVSIATAPAAFAGLILAALWRRRHTATRSVGIQR